MKKNIAVILLLCLCLSLCACGGDNWPDYGLAVMLPQPGSKRIEIISDYDDSYSANVTKFSTEDYRSYIKECEALGFNIDCEKDGSSYTAYNTEGYKLYLSYYESLEQLSINLDAPIEMSTIVWPTNTASQQLPIPKSSFGNIHWENKDGFLVYIGETTPSDYASYVEACKEMGFTVDYQKGDDFYYADNSAGFSLALKYEGYNIMYLRIDAPSEQVIETADETISETEQTKPIEETTTPATETTVETVAETEASTTSDSDGVDPELKAFLDEYEAFMDEYIAFMEKYENSDNTLGMIADYSRIMQQYAEFASALEKYDSSKMSVADAAYYLEVINRVNEKLLNSLD